MSGRPAVLGLLLVLTLTAPASGQADAAGAGRHGVAVGAGGLRHGLDDRAASPVRYEGAGAAMGALWERDASTWRWTVRAAGAYARLDSRLTDVSSGFEDAAWLTASVRAVRPVWRPRPSLTVWAGPGMAVDAGVRRHVYAPSTWLIFNDVFVALQAAGLAELGLGRWGELFASLAVPVLGAAARKPFPGAQDRPPAITVALPPSFLLVQHRLGYRVRLRGPLVARAFHEGAWIRHPEPAFAAASRRLGLALEWDLGWSR